jgi:hypothetical protein
MGETPGEILSFSRAGAPAPRLFSADVSELARLFRLALLRPAFINSGLTFARTRGSLHRLVLGLSGIRGSGGLDSSVLSQKFAA